jgi:hypothetical protein
MARLAAAPGDAECVVILNGDPDANALFRRLSPNQIDLVTTLEAVVETIQRVIARRHRGARG